MKCLKTGLLFQWNGETRCGDLKAEWQDLTPEGSNPSLKLHITGISQFTETVRPPECICDDCEIEGRKGDWHVMTGVVLSDITPELKSFLLKWSPAEAAAMGIRSEE